jgi:hypothetical protein
MLTLISRSVPQIDLSPIAPFVERSTEVSKTELLHRVEARIPGYLEAFLHQLVFFRVGKDERGELYVV